MNHPGSQNPEEVVIEYIVSFGTAGCSQSQVYARIKPAMSAQELTIYLTQLCDERKLDKYTIKAQKSGRPATWWRATTKILED